MGSKGPSPWRKSEDFEFLKKEYLGYRHTIKKDTSTDQKQMIKDNTKGGRKEGGHRAKDWGLWTWWGLEEDNWVADEGQELSVAAQKDLHLPRLDETQSQAWLELTSPVTCVWLTDLGSREQHTPWARVWHPREPSRELWSGPKAAVKAWIWIPKQLEE